MKCIYFIVFYLFTTTLSSQNIAIYNSYIYEKPSVITSVIGYETNWGHEPNVVFELSWDINKKLLLGARYFYDDYLGHVGFRWSPSDESIRWNGYANGDVKMIRFGTFGEYQVLNLWNKLSVSGRLYLEYEKYIPQFQLPNIRNVVGGVRDNVYIGPDQGTIFLTTYDSWQILPSMGLSLSYRPFWKVVLQAEAFYSHGFVTHSRLEFEYTDLEVEQPTAEFIGNGTSFNYSIGLGFRLWE